jgi:hypothetical protein
LGDRCEELADDVRALVAPVHGLREVLLVEVGVVNGGAQAGARFLADLRPLLGF